MTGLAAGKMRRRAEFLAAAKGRRIAMRTLVLQARERDEADAGGARIGFTVSRKVGNAVERNRVRRRLREAMRIAARGRLEAGHDYVIVGRRAALTSPYDRIVADLESALATIHNMHRTAGTTSTDG